MTTIRCLAKLVLILIGAALAACSTTRSIGEQVSDASITSTVNAKFAADPEVNPFEIDVDTQAGVVTLSGFVETEAERAEAEDLAHDTNGVKRVVNNIQMGDLSASEVVNDARITARLKSKLAADPQVSAINIDVDVDVDRGVVTLRGVVSEASSKEEAERLARATGGVTDVRNEIEVR